jgi:hypothetical protein
MLLSKKQLMALDEFFESGGDESSVLKKHNITMALWLKWNNSVPFVKEICRRIEMLKLQSDILISKYKPYAISQLLAQCKSENNETARKACVDLMGFVLNGKMPEPVEDTPTPVLDNETASKMLELLAESRRKSKVQGQFDD